MFVFPNIVTRHVEIVKTGHSESPAISRFDPSDVRYRIQVIRFACTNKASKRIEQFRHRATVTRYYGGAGHQRLSHRQSKRFVHLRRKQQCPGAGECFGFEFSVDESDELSVILMAQLGEFSDVGWFTRASGDHQFDSGLLCDPERDVDPFACPGLSHITRDHK